MSRKKKIFMVLVLTVLALAVTFRAGVAFGAGNGVPGSVNDPLITKSYLDARLAELGKTPGGSGGGGMIKLTLAKGEIVRGGEGTMFVLVSGSAFTSGSSVVNITAGQSLADGMSIAKYNTYLSVDAVGAIRADSSAVVFVNGSYKVEK